MASLNSLPADQRAVLELVLRQGRSYDQIAQLLGIDRAGVRARALAALDALGPQTRVPAERRALITDYLLGALPDGLARDVRDHLADSASERAWARVVSSELQEIASGPLPEVPSESRARTEPEAAVPARGAHPAPAGPPADAAREPAAVAAAAGPSSTPGDAGPAEPGPARRRPSSRVGGAVLLAGGAVVVAAVVLIVVLSGGSSPKHTPSASTSHRTSTTPKTATTATTKPQILAQINLKPPGGGASPVGIAEVLRQQGTTGIAIVAQGLAPNTKSPANAYAVWLSNSSTDSKILGFVNPAVGSNGRLQTAGGLPSNASHYHKLLITLETQSSPKTPGKVVLEGALTGVS